MCEALAPISIRRGLLPGPDSETIRRLVGAYLHQTELEKAAHSFSPTHSTAADLPLGYRAEAEHPEVAFADAVVYVAEMNSQAVGVAVALPTEDGIEVKRLWADPGARGKGVGSALLDAVLGECHGVVRLSVWGWRIPAIRLYESRGFVEVAPWDDRPELRCMKRAPGR